MAALAAVSAVALVATGCSASPAADDDGPITLTIPTFGTMGLDGLYALY
jgi:cellobiose transport system substrate-binding protein